MEEQSKENITVKWTVIGSIVLAISHSLLFWNQTVGISACIFSILVLIYLYHVLEENKKIKNERAILFSIPIVLLSATYFIFHNIFFRFLNFFAIIGLFILMTILLTTKKETIQYFVEKILRTVFGPVEFLPDICKITKEEIHFKAEGADSKKAKKMIKAILISLPIALLVIVLLSEADTVFASLFSSVNTFLGELFNITGLGSLVARIVVAFLLFAYFGAYSLNLIKENTPYNNIEQTAKESKWKIERLTINTLLTILNVIYLIFSMIQFIYLFTQAGVGENFDYSSYARKGFFELMWVSLLNLVMLFVAHTRIKKQENQTDNYMKRMSLMMIFFTTILIFSSSYRMYLYEQAYGYTYLRLLVYFVLATEMLCLIPTAIYLHNKKLNLFCSILTITITMYVILNYINIDQVIAKKNIDRYLVNPAENKLDDYYLRYSLGIDAIPELTKLTEVEDIAIQNNMIRYLQSEKENLENILKEKTVFEWNYGVQKAKNSLDGIEKIQIDDLLFPEEFSERNNYSNNNIENVLDKKGWTYSARTGFFDLDENRPLYGFEIEIVYQAEEKTFLLIPRMGEYVKIKQYIVTNTEIAVVVDKTNTLPYNFYGVEVNRKKEGFPDVTASNYEQGAILEYSLGSDMKIVMPFGKAFAEGEIQNIRVSFGKVD